MKRTLSLVLLTAAACVGAADPDVEEAPPLIVTHLAYEGERPGLEPVNVGDRQLFVERQAVFSDPDIIGVNAFRSEKEVFLDVRLDPAGAERLRTTTAENIGRSMVIMFDSRIVSAPTIFGEIGSSPRLQMAVPAGSAKEADDIVALVRARWPSENESVDG